MGLGTSASRLLSNIHRGPVVGARGVSPVSTCPFEQQTECSPLACGGELAALRRAACSACARARVLFQSSASLIGGGLTMELRLHGLEPFVELRPELPD